MADLLTDFLSRSAGRDFGFHLGADCGLWPCEWVRVCTGIDPSAEARGKYQDAASLTDFLRSKIGRMGWPVYAARLMRRAGFAATAEAVPGDIGIVLSKQLGAVGAIRTDTGWAFPQAHGFRCLPKNVRVLVAWRVRCL